MKKFFSVAFCCLVIMLLGCNLEEGASKMPVKLSTTDNLVQTLDEVSYEIISESLKIGKKKLLIPAVLASEPRVRFLAEELLRRLYQNPRLTTYSFYDLTAKKNGVTMADLNQDSPLLSEMGIDSLLLLELKEKQQELTLTVRLLGYPQSELILSNKYLIKDQTSALVTSMINGTYRHPLSLVGSVAWEEDFEQGEPNIGRMYGEWFVQQGQYTARGASSDTLAGNMAISTAPLPITADVIFEGDCTLAQDGEGGLMLRGQSPENAVFVTFNAKLNRTGFILRHKNREKWIEPATGYQFPLNKPFHFKVIVSGRYYVLLLDGQAVTKVDNADFGNGQFGIYINAKGGLPVLWDNLRVSR